MNVRDVVSLGYGRALVAGAAIFVATACGGGADPGPQTSAPPEADRSEDATPLTAEAWSVELEARGGENRPLVPVGYGSLAQGDIAVSLRSGELQIQLVPLAEWVIRLTAPDTYRRLNGYKVSRSEEILNLANRSGVRGWPMVALVTFFSRSLEESFEPYDLQINNQGRLYRPLDIVEVTPSFGRDRLAQQETQVALYLFSPDIDLNLPTTVQYSDASSDRWNGIRSTLDSERSRANSRAGAGQP